MLWCSAVIVLTSPIAAASAIKNGSHVVGQLLGTRNDDRDSACLDVAKDYVARWAKDSFEPDWTNEIQTRPEVRHLLSRPPESSFDLPQPHHSLTKLARREQDALDCLMSVQLNIQDALGTIEAVEKFVRMHSNLANLKDPRFGRNHDVIGTLDNIARRVSDHSITSQYEFELTIELALQRAYDMRLSWTGFWARSVFKVKRSESLHLVSLSSDGKAPPKVYLWDALIYGQLNAVEFIDGKPVLDVLQEGAAAWPFACPHARYNSMFRPPTVPLDSQVRSGFVNPFFFPDLETKIRFEDKTESSWPITAVVANNVNWRSLLLTGDAYSNFVRLQSPDPKYTGDWPAFAPGPLRARSIPYSITSRWSHDLLSTATMGKLAILKLQNFINAPATMRGVVTLFKGFREAQADDKPRRLIIDLRGNIRGEVKLATFIAHQIFPQILTGNPKMRFRSSAALDEIKDAVDTNDQLPMFGEDVAGMDTHHKFVSAETRQPFEEWEDLFGPQTSEAGDDVSAEIILETNWPDEPLDQVFMDWQVTLISDSLCGNVCSYFVELLSQTIDGDFDGSRIRRITLGGLPSPGPSTITGASKGLENWDQNLLIRHVQHWLDHINEPLGIWPGAPLPGPVRSRSASVGRYDILRADPRFQQIPIEFVYDKAHCRLYYTANTARDSQELYRKVAEVAWGGPGNGIDGEKCVEGSYFAAPATAA